MSKILKTLLGIGVVVLLLGSYFVGKYNTMVTKDEAVKTAWSQVENVYQRRLDLIPNLVNTVKGYADFEQETLTAVINARASATQTKINVNDADAFAQFESSQGELSSALRRLMVVVESYPELKADQRFGELQAEIAGTENRISVERRTYNETVQPYNVYIRSFPNNLMARMFGFEKAELFKATEGASVAPAVNFE